MQTQTYTPQADYGDIAIPEQSLKYHTVHVRVKDATARLDIDTFVAVEATSSSDAIWQAKQAFRNAYNRPPFYESYEVL